MEADTPEAITALLLRAEEAHGHYEALDLNGVYDEDWARWYAEFAIESGLAELVGHAAPLDRVTALLEGAFADFDAADPKPTGTWAEYVGRRMAAEL